MIYPYISFSEIEGNKTIVLTYMDDNRATQQYGLFHFAELNWFGNDDGLIEIHIIGLHGSEFKISLINTIEKYVNYKWFTNEELTHITTASALYPSGKTPVLPFLYRSQPIV